MKERIMVQRDDLNGALYQWDTGQRMWLIHGAAGWRVDFLYDGGEPLSVESYEEGGRILTDIPNILLQKSGFLRMLIYARTERSGETVVEQVLKVISRPKPSDYVYTETEVKSWTDLEERVSALEEGGGGENTLSLLIETDMLPAVRDANGAILTDESGNVILRY